VADTELFYNWRSKQGKDSFVKTSDSQVSDKPPAEKMDRMSREVLSDRNPLHTLDGVIARISFNAPALGDLTVSKGVSFFAEDKTGTTRPGMQVLPVHQQDLRAKIKTPVLSATPGAAEPLPTTAQQQDKAGPANSDSSRGENEIPLVLMGPSIDLRDRIKGLTHEEKERARLVNSC
jgi:hypothetical protein